MIIRRETLKTALLCRATDHISGRTATLGGVHLRPDGTVEATDGHILVRVTERYPFKDEDFPTVPGVASELAAPERGILLPTEIAQKLIAAMPKRTPIPILHAARVGTVDGQPYALATDLETPLVVSLERAQERGAFPGTDRILSGAAAGEGEGVLHLALSAEILRILAEIGKSVGSKGTACTIQLHIPTRGQDYQDGQLMSGIRFTATGGDLTVEGVAMPCRI